jgi:hypothetical protein
MLITAFTMNTVHPSASEARITCYACSYEKPLYHFKVALGRTGRGTPIVGLQGTTT